MDHRLYPGKMTGWAWFVALSGRQRQLEKPLLETSSTSNRIVTGHFACLSRMKQNFTSGLQKKWPLPFEDVALDEQPPVLNIGQSRIYS